MKTWTPREMKESLDKNVKGGGRRRGGKLFDKDFSDVVMHKN